MRTSLARLLATLTVAALTATGLSATPLGSPAAYAGPTAAAPAKPAKPSSTIVYVCQVTSNLCSVDPATGKVTVLTTDGNGDRPYGLPSFSADGSLLAVAHGTIVEAGPVAGPRTEWTTAIRGLNDVAMAPDGSGVAHSYEYSEIKYVYCYPYGSCLRTYYYSGSVYQPAGSPQAQVENEGSYGVAYAPDKSLIVATTKWEEATSQSFKVLCRITDPTLAGQPCVDIVRYQGIQAHYLGQPAVSPDGKLIAVEIGTPGDSMTTASLGLFDATTGAAVGTLAAEGYRPTFSPDGSQVAYQGADGWIYVVPTTGGTPTRLVEGHSPAWGKVAAGAAAGTAKVAKSKKPIKVKKALKLTVTCTKAAPCSGTLTVTAKGKQITKPKAYAIPAGGKQKVTAKLTKAGKKLLKKGKVVKATATVAGSSTKVKLRR